MDSPESVKLSRGDATETVALQESPVFSYISKLSPIQPVKEPSVLQGFPGFNSPPIVFTSPRLISQSQSSFLERSEFPPFPSANLSRKDGGCSNSITAADRSRELGSQLGSGLGSCREEGLGSRCPMDDQTESPIQCADKFLADSVHKDSFDSNGSSNLSLTNSNKIDHPPVGVTNSKESVMKLECRPLKRRNEEPTSVAASATTEQTEKVHKTDASLDSREVETETPSKYGHTPVDQCAEFESNLSENLALTNKHPENSLTEVSPKSEATSSFDAKGSIFIYNLQLQNAEDGQTANLEDSYLLSRAIQIYEENENSVETTGALAEPVVNEMQSNPMAVQHRGVLVRCLQFEEAQQKVITNRLVQNPSGIENSSRLLASPSVREGSRPLSLETPQAPIGRAGMTQHLSYPRNSGNFSLKGPMPSGIGLHLNSILTTMRIGSGETINVKSDEKGTFNIRDEEQVNPVSSSFLSASRSIPGSADDNSEIHALAAANSAAGLSSYNMKPLDNLMVYNPVENQSTPMNQQNSITGSADNAEGFYKSSPRKKRKKTSESNNDISCKRCNCKKSKCLKLYCDCFAAGIYCADPCSCQGCFNRPEYEDTVLETRQQIESRNPLAFAPKIVQHFTEEPPRVSGEDETQVSKSSGRHKRGCNCKKSKCLKKYCECYQSKVGCSDGCRCEGCENVYGQKGEYGMVNNVGMQGTDEATDTSFAEKLEMVGSGNVSYHTELHNSNNLTPPTPSFQYSDHGKGASRAWFASGTHFQSPEPGLAFGASSIRCPRSPRNSGDPDMISGTSNEILDLVSFDHELDYRKTGRGNDFSSGYHGPGNMELLAGLGNAQENNSKVQSFSASGRFSSADTLRWCDSPITPMVQFSGTKLPQAVDFYDDLHEIVEDDTPAILKDAPNPLNAMKVSSPNKKRVSPPHGPSRELGSNSSTGLKIARKFILQAVPSFPPLTPCVESKNDGHEKT